MTSVDGPFKNYAKWKPPTPYLMPPVGPAHWIDAKMRPIQLAGEEGSSPDVIAGRGLFDRHQIG